MAVPDFQSLMRPLLHIAADGKEHALADARAQVEDLCQANAGRARGVAAQWSAIPFRQPSSLGQGLPRAGRAAAAGLGAATSGYWTAAVKC